MFLSIFIAFGALLGIWYLRQPLRGIAWNERSRFMKTALAVTPLATAFTALLCVVSLGVTGKVLENLIPGLLCLIASIMSARRYLLAKIDEI